MCRSDHINTIKMTEAAERNLFWPLFNYLSIRFGYREIKRLLSCDIILSIVFSERISTSALYYSIASSSLRLKRERNHFYSFSSNLGNLTPWRITKKKSFSLISHYIKSVKIYGLLVKTINKKSSCIYFSQTLLVLFWK